MVITSSLVAKSLGLLPSIIPSLTPQSQGVLAQGLALILLSSNETSFLNLVQPSQLL